MTATVPVLAALLLTTAAGAQVDCSDPDNLCTGDPCTITGQIEVQSPCVVDFGSRALVVEGTVRAEDAAVIDFTAASIAVPGTIRVTDYAVPFPVGGDIMLTAASDIVVDGRLLAEGEGGGSVALDAGGDVSLHGPVKTSGRFEGGRVTIDAGGNVEVARVAANGILGLVTVTAGGDLVVRKTLTARLPGYHPSFDAGDVALMAGGTVQVLGSIRASAQSSDVGGDVVVRGTAGVTVERPIEARGFGLGGNVEVSSSGGPVTVSNRIDARAQYNGGTVRLRAATTLSATGSLLARGIRSNGGDVFARGATVVLDAPNADVRGGEGHPGGTIEGTATGNLTASGTFRAVPNGCVALAAEGTLDTSAATFDTALVADCPGSPSGAFLD